MERRVARTYRIHHQTHPKAQRDIQQLGRVGIEGLARGRRRVDGIGAAEGEEEEHEGADELGQHGDQVVFERLGTAADEGDAPRRRGGRVAVFQGARCDAAYFQPRARLPGHPNPGAGTVDVHRGGWLLLSVWDV